MAPETTESRAKPQSTLQNRLFHVTFIAGVSLQAKGRPVPRLSRFVCVAIGFLILIAGPLCPEVSAARFVAYFPLPADSREPDRAAQNANALQNANASNGNLSLPISHPRVGEALAVQWQSYCDAWRQHHTDPRDAITRNRLGLAGNTIEIKKSSGRSTVASMRLPLGDLARYESDHFMLLSDVNDERATDVLRDLERFHAVWTQLFFPLWRERGQWDRSVKSSRPRVTIKHRVVLLSNKARYAEILRAEGPGIGQSTGFYSDLKRVTFLTEDAEKFEDEKAASRYHEVTHQLMTEATDAKARIRPGERRDFWLVEGIACYMESVLFREDQATVGGWQASRLQYGRHRVLATGDQMTWADLVSEGRLAVQQREDLARWYSFAATYTHRMIDEDNGSGLIDTLDRLATVYQMRSPFESNVVNAVVNDESSLETYLQIDDAELAPAGTTQLRHLCLTRTSVTSDGLALIEPQTELRWLDLSFLKVTAEMVQSLAPNASNLEQLSLEATQIDDSIGPWIGKALHLRELDLSSTRAGDEAFAMIPDETPIETLWLTGSQVTDALIERMISWKRLERVDLQRTAVTEAGLERLRAARPDLEINPLEIAAP